MKRLLNEDFHEPRKERKLGFYGTPTQVVLYGAN
jgi:hypothetical protein